MEMLDRIIWAVFFFGMGWMGHHFRERRKIERTTEKPKKEKKERKTRAKREKPAAPPPSTQLPME